MNYQFEYDNLISYRKNNILEKSEKLYTELHHIIPRCLFPNNTPINIINHPSNLVRVTGKEHYLLHYYLYHCYEKDTYEYKSTLAAFDAMNIKSIFTKNRYYNAELYEDSKKDLLEQLKENNIKDLKNICEWIIINKRNPSRLVEGEKNMYYKINNFKSSKRNHDGFGIYYKEYQDIIESYGIGDLFDRKDNSQIQYNNIIDICNFIDKNGKCPNQKSKDEFEAQLGSKLSQIKQKNKKNKLYDGSLELLEELGHSDILIIKTNEEKMCEKIEKFCLFVKLNGYPKRSSFGQEKQLYNFFHKLKRIKQNKIKKQKWHISYSIILDNYNISLGL